MIHNMKEELNREKLKNQNQHSMAANHDDNRQTGYGHDFGQKNNKHSLVSMDEEKQGEYKDLAEKFLQELVDDLPVENVLNHIDDLQVLRTWCITFI